MLVVVSAAGVEGAAGAGDVSVLGGREFVTGADSERPLSGG